MRRFSRRHTMLQPQEHIINLRKESLGEHQFAFRLDDAYFAAQEKSEVLGGDVQVAGTLHLRESSFSIDMQVSGMVRLVCDRCLDSMDYELQSASNHLESTELDDEAGGKPTETLDVAWLAYEWIIVNLPVVHCHPEGGCNPQMDALLQHHLCSIAEEPEDKK